MSLLDPPRLVCSSGCLVEEAVVIFARAADGRAVTAGGDIFGVVLTRGTEEYHPLTVIDRCDGTYSVLLPCAALQRGSEYAVSALLEHSLRRDRVRRALWYCGMRAGTNNFTAWDALTYKQLQELYHCSGKSVGTRAASILVDKPLGAAEDEWNSARISLNPASCFPAAWRGPSLVATAAPLLMPCTVSAAVERTMRFQQAGFHHCVRTGDPTCSALDYEAEIPRCLEGTRVVVVGDSVIEGMFADFAHMWAKMQRTPAGMPINTDAKHICRWDARLKRMAPVYSPPTQIAIPSKREASDARRASASSLNVTLLNVKWPYRRGLGNFVGGRLAAVQNAIRTHDIVIMESSRHDFAPPRGRGPEMTPLGTYRRRAAELAQKCSHAVESEWRRRGTNGTAPRILWRTALPPPGIQGRCNHPSNNPAVIHVANVAASAEFAARGLEVVPQHVWGRAFYNPHIWPHNDEYADVHTHEGWCTPMYLHPGIVHGWISKALTQLTMLSVTEGGTRCMRAGNS